VESKTATPAVLATEAKEDGTARYTNIKNNKQSKFYDSSGLIFTLSILVGKSLSI